MDQTILSVILSEPWHEYAHPSVEQASRLRGQDALPTVAEFAPHCPSDVNSQSRHAQTLIQ